MKLAVDWNNDNLVYWNINVWLGINEFNKLGQEWTYWYLSENYHHFVGDTFKYMFLNINIFVFWTKFDWNEFIRV